MAKYVVSIIEVVAELAGESEGFWAGSQIVVEPDSVRPFEDQMEPGLVVRLRCDDDGEELAADVELFLSPAAAGELVERLRSELAGLT